MQLLDLGPILVAYMEVQNTLLHHHATPLQTTYSKQQKWESSTCDVVVFCLKRGSGMFPDMSSYAKLNRLVPNYKPSTPVMKI